MAKGREIVMKVVGRCAPEEEFLAESYNPGNKTSIANGPLGIGVSGAIVLLTPIVWKIVQDFETDLLKDVSKGLAKDVSDYIRKKLFDSPSQRAERSRIEANVTADLKAAGLEAGRCPEVAKAIVDELVTSKLQ